MPPSFLRRKAEQPGVILFGGAATGTFAGSANEFAAFATATKYWKPVLQAAVIGGHTYLQVTDWLLVGFSGARPATGYLGISGAVIPSPDGSPPAGAAIFEPSGSDTYGPEGGSSGTGGD